MFRDRAFSFWEINEQQTPTDRTPERKVSVVASWTKFLKPGHESWDPSGDVSVLPADRSSGATIKPINLEVAIIAHTIGTHYGIALLRRIAVTFEGTVLNEKRRHWCSVTIGPPTSFKFSVFETEVRGVDATISIP
jgi:hypothetical protein